MPLLFRVPRYLRRGPKTLSIVKYGVNGNVAVTGIVAIKG